MHHDAESQVPDLETMAEDIETMRIRGAGAIARHAVAALARWEGDARDFTGFPAAIRRLLATRPTAVSLRNGLEFVERRVDAAAGEPAKRAALRDAAAQFDARAKDALATLGRVGAARIEDGGSYLTHCNSQAAIAVFRAAHATGKRFAVTATETRPWRQGLLTAKNLREAGLDDVRLAVDASVNLLLRDIDAVIVGADTIAANGDVVNKIGTSLVALAASDHGVPFHVATETFKVDLRPPPAPPSPSKNAKPPKSPPRRKCPLECAS